MADTTDPVAQVIHTAELLEAILIHLDMKTLLLSQRVSRTFKAVIDRSPTLRRHLWLDPDPAIVGIGEVGEEAPMINPLILERAKVLDIVELEVHSSMVMGDRLSDICFTHQCQTIETWPWGSWDSMILVQPFDSDWHQTGVQVTTDTSETHTDLEKRIYARDQLSLDLSSSLGIAIGKRGESVVQTALRFGDFIRAYIEEPPAEQVVRWVKPRGETQAECIMYWMAKAEVSHIKRWCGGVESCDGCLRSLLRRPGVVKQMLHAPEREDAEMADV